ncbi:MAG TPA: hypothetical protein PLX15_00355 [Candidatus Woesearchaeota archaeon]|nr:hypothetical protein [Candidatus Woesearchaeota archaeon]
MIKKTKILSLAIILSLLILELTLAQSVASYSRKKNVFSEINNSILGALKAISFEIPFIYLSAGRFVVISIPLFVLIFAVYALMNIIRALFMMLPKFNEAKRSITIASVAISLLVLMMTKLLMVLSALFFAAIELEYGVFLIVVLILSVWFITKKLPNILNGLLHKGGYM